LNFWGKLVGGGLGYLLAGPWGLVIGAFFGHQFDRGLASFQDGVMGGAHQALAQQAFFEATFSIMGHMAKIDGRVSEQEIALAREVMARMGLSEQSRLLAIELFTQGKQPGFDPNEVLTRFLQASRRARNLHQMFIEIQLHAAYADGAMDAAERGLLLSICETLGFSEADLDRLDAMIRAERHAGGGGPVEKVSLDDAYAILNITPEATDAEVKRAYRRLTSQHHPDKLVAKGLPEDMMKLAQEKTHEIRTAYERIRDSRGF